MSSPDDDVEAFRQAERRATDARRQLKAAWRTMAKSLFVQLAHTRRENQQNQQKPTTSRAVYREVMMAHSVPESAAFVIARANWYVCVARLFLKLLRRDVLFHRAAEVICSRRYASQIVGDVFSDWRGYVRDERRRRRRLVRMCAEHWCKFVARRLVIRRVIERFRARLRLQRGFRKACELRRLRVVFSLWGLRHRSIQAMRTRTLRGGISTGASLQDVFNLWKTRTERRLWLFAADKQCAEGRLRKCFDRWRWKLTAKSNASGGLDPSPFGDAAASSRRKGQVLLVRIPQSNSSTVNIDFKLHCAEKIAQAVLLGSTFTRWRRSWHVVKASARFRLSVLRRGLDVWRDHLHARLASRVLLSRVFFFWRRKWTEVHDERVASELTNRKLLSSCFSLWQKVFSARRHNKAFPLRRCLRKWAEKTAVRRCRATLDDGKLRRHLRAWWSYCRLAVNRRTNFLVAVAIHTEVVRAGCFRWWRRRAEESARVKMMVAVLDTLRLERLRRDCFSRWKAAFESGKKREGATLLEHRK